MKKIPQSFTIGAMSKRDMSDCIDRNGDSDESNCRKGKEASAYCAGGTGYEADDRPDQGNLI